MAWFTSDIEKKTKIVINKQQLISVGSSSNYTLTNPFNNKTKWVTVEINASGTVVTMETIPFERFKQINTAADLRIFYHDGSYYYNAGIYYVNNSTIHLTGYNMPTNITIIVRSIEEDY